MKDPVIFQRPFSHKSVGTGRDKGSAAAQSGAQAAARQW